MLFKPMAKTAVMELQKIHVILMAHSRRVGSMDEVERAIWDDIAVLMSSHVETPSDYEMTRETTGVTERNWF